MWNRVSNTISSCSKQSGKYCCDGNGCLHLDQLELRLAEDNVKMKSNLTTHAARGLCHMVHSLVLLTECLTEVWRPPHILHNRATVMVAHSIVQMTGLQLIIKFTGSCIPITESINLMAEVRSAMRGLAYLLQVTQMLHHRPLCMGLR